MSAALAPIAPLAISCAKNDTKKQEGAKSESSALNKDDFTLAKESFAKLTDDQKLQVLKDTKLGEVYSKDQLYDIIAKFNKDVGSFGGIIWSIKSAEALIAKEAAYMNGIVAFDNLMKDQENSEFVFNRDYNTLKQVNNVEASKFVPVVFMDIDETVLQNDLTEANAMINGGFKNSNKEAEDLKARRFAVPGAVEFINHVQSKGGLVIYNSDMNLSTEIRDTVKRNLERVGVKYVANFQFWMRGALPNTSDIDAEITKAATATKSQDELKALAKRIHWNYQAFNAKPWEPWNNSLSAQEIGKTVSKTDRMNGLDNNANGWNLHAEDNKSGEAVKMKTIMRVGDNFNDFFDNASKGKTNDERTGLYKAQRTWMKDIFSVKGAMAHTYDKASNQFTTGDYKQAYIMVPGNAEYGGWNERLGYGNVKNFYDAIKQLVSNPRYESGPSATDNIVRR
ncbi:HAD family acid phosphatase [Mycoplasma struthionis]|uniref:Acid phosphatase n=1 Tax=Mycoplasma struthionis TaxID=538220 RepID=A0A502M842_9MOLU|nr:HAD family acid phosphatase [Mycoplasma struthionis]TPI02961.1 acid phosphatase [Mycoplasma struthionis]